ncbi:MAG: hypothetical protein R6U96_08080 [Promethearchaeia archaeon]
MSTKDLTLLKDIGVKEVEKLETIGVKTIEQLADANLDELITLDNVRFDKAQAWIRKAQDYLKEDESLLEKTKQKEIEMESKYSLKSTEQRDNETNYLEDEVREGELRSEK